MSWLVDIGLYLFDRVYNSPDAKGRRGESRVSKALRKGLPPEDYFILDDLTLPIENSTTQIDHTILSRFGIFVVETKNKTGWIFGSQNNSTWTQTFRSQNFKFQNPLRQNYRHVKAIEDILGLSDIEVHNVVAFVGSAEPRTDFPQHVLWSVGELVQFIKQHDSVSIDPKKAQSMFAKLQAMDLGNCETVSRQHRENVEVRIEKKTRDKHNCPQCGANMLERRNKSSGDVFLGCSRFPSCRGTRQIKADNSDV